jgi:nicotine blue oxidoreductase
LLVGGCDDVVAVVRSAEVRAADARCVVNPDADSGMASSLRCGLQAVTAAAAVIVLVDQVGITSAQVATLIDSYRAGAPVVAACRDGMRSHPVLVSRPWFGDFGAAAVGDSGARAFLDSRTDIVRFIDFDAPITDIDTPADLAALQ